MGWNGLYHDDKSFNKVGHILGPPAQFHKYVHWPMVTAEDMASSRCLVRTLNRSDPWGLRVGLNFLQRLPRSTAIVEDRMNPLGPLGPSVQYGVSVPDQTSYPRSSNTWSQTGRRHRSRLNADLQHPGFILVLFNSLPSFHLIFFLPPSLPASLLLPSLYPF